jgi:putative colanic acid biosynthesis UDP-glucose lipid carrier transferase
MLDIIQARVDTMVGLPVVAVCETPFHGTTGVIKRLSDLCIAAAAVILTAPIMLLTAIAIKLTMPGPVLFKQRRYGLDGQEITVWKFRTMKVQENGPEIRQATRDDDRITPLGRFLRRTSLDELPQFFNVLQGRMSVVGPRPHAVAHNEMYRKLIKGYMIRHKVKPGITGLAQISLGYTGEIPPGSEIAKLADTLQNPYGLEETRGNLADDMRIKLLYDLAYTASLEKLSTFLSTELRIIARTPLVMLKMAQGR